jgi:LuxR family glucitol operon transcriptional activator
MAGAVSPQRIYLFSIISSIEHDLRNVIEKHIVSTVSKEQLFTPAEEKRILIRMRAHGEDGIYPSETSACSQKINFMDYGDAISLINRHRKVLPKAIAEYFREMTPVLERIIEPRNAVMHSRPITSGHVATVQSIANELNQQGRVEWNNLSQNYKKLKDPKFLMDVTFVPEPEQSNVIHNLPPPDFDDTGFVGRENLLRELKAAILGSHPVITVLGEGGLGKSAITLKAAYDLIDDPECPFELVVWVTSKVAKLGTREIERIEGAISTSLGVIEEAIITVNDAVGSSGMADPEEGILEYMRQFKVLLIIDNLETILDERIRNFVRRIPKDSKIIFTSRIGTGMDLPIHVGPFNNDEAKYYIRELIQSYNVTALTKKNADEITKICTRLNKNPLFMKWFVLAVNQGITPESLLGNPGLALEFCMSNVFDSFSKTELETSYAFLALNGKPTFSEIAYITGMEPYDLQSVLSQLLIANILRIEANEIGETVYGMADLSRSYLVRLRPPAEEFMQRLYAKRRQLRADVESDTGLEVSPYRPGFFYRRHKSDSVVIKILKEAILHVRKQQFSDAKNKLDRAEILSPDYFEVKRALAFYYFSLQDYQKAQDSYERAIDAAPDHAPLRHFYGGFLLRAFEDTESALKHFEIGLKIDPQSVDLKIDVARAALYINRFEVTEKFIEELKREKTLTFKMLQIVFDLEVQTHTRKAEHYRQAQDPVSQLNAYENLSESLKEIPVEFRDRKLLERIDVAVKNLQQLAHGFKLKGAVEKAAQAEDYSRLLGEFLTHASSSDEQNEPQQSRASVPNEGRYLGVMFSYNPQRKYGFLTYERERWFFHATSFLTPFKNEQLAPGTKVMFSFGENEKGPCAIDIEFLKE